MHPRAEPDFQLFDGANVADDLSRSQNTTSAVRQFWSIDDYASARGNVSNRRRSSYLSRSVNNSLTMKNQDVPRKAKR
jgi:hypothetical protein